MQDSNKAGIPPIAVVDYQPSGDRLLSKTLGETLYVGRETSKDYQSLNAKIFTRLGFLTQDYHKRGSGLKRVHQGHLQLNYLEDRPIPNAEEEIARLSSLEDELLTKKLRGAISQLEEFKLDSIQEQIDQLLGIPQSAEADLALLGKFDQLLKQGEELLERLRELTRGRDHS